MDGFCHPLRIAPVDHAIVAKWNIADGNVHVIVWDVRILEALDPHIVVWVQILRNLAGHSVQLHHGPALDAGSHVCRHTADEIANAAAGLQHPSTLEAQFFQAVIHGGDHFHGRIVGVLRAFAHAPVFVFGNNTVRHKLPQLLEFLFPAGLCPHLAFPGLPVIGKLSESAVKPAPAHIPGQNLLFLPGGKPSLLIQLVNQAQRRDIVPVSCLFSFCQVQAFTDGVVFSLRLFRRLPLDLPLNGFRNAVVLIYVCISS